MWLGILTWTRKRNDSIKCDKWQEVREWGGESPSEITWQLLGILWIQIPGTSQPSQPMGLPIKYSDLTAESQSLSRNGVAKIWNQNTLAFGLPVTTEPNKQRQPVTLDGHLTQMAGYLRRWWVHTLTDQLLFSFQAKVFIAGNKQGVVRGFEIQGKVNWNKTTTSAFLSWAVVISPWSTMAQISSWIACSPLEAQRWNCFWSPGVRVGQPFSSWNKSFYMHWLLSLLAITWTQLFQLLSSLSMSPVAQVNSEVHWECLSISCCGDF